MIYRYALFAICLSFTMGSALAQQATEKEIADFNKYLVERQGKDQKSIELPFAFTSGAVNFAGTITLREPFEDSSLRAIGAGAVIGVCDLNKARTDCRLYDPTSQFVRAVLAINFPGKEIRARVDTRKLDGRWSEGDWVVAWRQ